MRPGNSLRFRYANGDHSLRIYREYILTRGEFSDIPLGVHDTRAQAGNLLELAEATAKSGLRLLDGR